MTQTIIHSLLDIEKPIDTDILVYVKEGKELPKDALDRLTTQPIVASKTFCPLTVKYHLDFNGADYILPLFEKEVLSNQPKEIQEAYKKVIHSFFIKGEEWFIMIQKEYNDFVSWMLPMKNHMIDTLEQNRRGQCDISILNVLVPIWGEIFEKSSKY